MTATTPFARFLARFKHRHATRAAYLTALRAAFAGAAPGLAEQAATDCERRFAEGAAAGRSEADVAQALPDPRKLAAEAKAAASKSAFAGRKSVPNLWRLFIALLGLAIFNLFMVIPAVVFCAFLAAFYAVAFAFYVAGIAVAAGGVSGVDEITFDRAGAHTIAQSGVSVDVPTRLSVDADGVRLRGGSTADDGGLRFSAGLDAYSRSQQTLGGIGLIAGGILMLLLSLVVTKYALIGLKRYVVLNYRMLVTP